MIELRPNILIISIDVNGLNSPIERKGLSDWLIKQNPTLCRIQDTPLAVCGVPLAPVSTAWTARRTAKKKPAEPIDHAPSFPEEPFT